MLNAKKTASSRTILAVDLETSFFFFLQNRETNTFTVGELLALRITEKRPVEIGLGPLPNTSIINPWGAD